MAIDIQFDGEVVDRASKFQLGEIAMATRSSATNKSKAPLDVPYRDRPRQVYQEVDGPVVLATVPTR
jgi:hypothetical protein